MWSPDGRELFFIDNDGWLTSVSVDTREGFATGLPVRLFLTRAYAVEANSRPFDISRDGRFVFMKSSDDAGSFINVVTNWHANR